MNAEDRTLVSDRVARVFEAQSVAVVGASDSPGPGRNVVHNLAELGFGGPVFLVNRSHRTVAGRHAFADLEELPTTPDLVVVAVNQRATVEIVRSAAVLDVPAAVLLAAGFREVGEEGARLETELLGARGSMSLVGPNCLGFANYLGAFAPFSGPLVTQKHVGDVALVSNSGALACTLTGAAEERRISFSHVVTMGNQADLELADYVRYLATKPQVEVIACYVEGFEDGRAVLSAFHDANANGKLVVVLKAGRSRLGARASKTHTGALAGSAVVQEGLFSHAGVVIARDLEELLALIELGGRNPHLRTRRVGVITTSGGERLLLADALEENSLELAELSDSSVRALRELLPPFATVANPLDTTGAGIFEGDVKTHYEAARVMARDPGVDLLLASYDAKNGWLEDSQRAPAFVDGVIAAHRAAEEAGKPVVIMSLTAGMVDPLARNYLEEHSVPCLMGLRPSIRALSLLLNRNHQSPMAVGEAVSYREDSAPLLPSADGVQLGHSAAVERLESVGLRAWPSQIARGEDEAASAADHFGYPVVLKWDTDVAHRARQGGVVIGLNREREVREAWRLLADRSARQRVAVDAVIVQPLVEGGTELFLGGLRDPQFGPIVLFGLGGLFVEHERLISSALAPMTFGEAESFVIASSCAGVLAERERAGLIDRQAIVHAVRSVAALITSSDVVAVDVNPIIALPQGVAVIDCKIIVCPGVAEPDNPMGRVG